MKIFPQRKVGAKNDFIISKGGRSIYAFIGNGPQFDRWFNNNIYYNIINY